MNEAQIASLQLIKNSQAEIYINEQKYHLIRKKSWSRSFQVLNDHNHLIIEAIPHKWYSNHLVLRYQHQEYLLSQQNNPLPETILQDLYRSIGLQSPDTSHVRQLKEYAFFTALWYCQL